MEKKEPEKEAEKGEENPENALSWKKKKENKGIKRDSEAKMSMLLRSVIRHFPLSNEFSDKKVSSGHGGALSAEQGEEARLEWDKKTARKWGHDMRIIF